MWDEKNKVLDLTPNLHVPIFENFSQAPIVEFKNKIYIPTYGNGIMVVDLGKQEISFITVNEGLPNMYLYSMFIDDENNIWASSNKGILKFHPEVLNSDNLLLLTVFKNMNITRVQLGNQERVI